MLQSRAYFFKKLLGCEVAIYSYHEFDETFGQDI